MTCDERRDLLLLYVSDALEASEADELRRHLQTGCPACAGHLAEAEAVMAAVPLGLDPVAPPPHLKSRLMERIAVASPPEISISKSVVINPTESIAMQLFRYLIPAAVAAGLAIIITHFVMNQRVTELQQQATALKEERNATAMQLINQQQQLDLLKATNQASQSATRVVDLLRSPDLKLVHLDATPLQPHAVANLLWDKKDQQWAILTDGMTPAAPGQTYELWFIPVTGNPVEAGTFDVDASGKGSLKVSIPPGMGPLKVAAVTNEKAGGVPAPEGKAQVAGSVE